MMTVLERLALRTGEEDTNLLTDLAETAKNVILSRRFPYGEYPTREVIHTVGDSTSAAQETYVEDRYLDLQFRIAMDLYNKIGAEGETAHDENGIKRTFESSWISSQLLAEVTPYCGVIS